MTEPVAPRPWYRHKAATPAAIAVLLLAIVFGLVALGQSRQVADQAAAAPVAAAAAPADAAGQKLLADLAYVGVVSTEPAQMVALGHKVCTAFDVGGTYWQIMASLKAGNYTTEQASKVIAVSAADMCPRHDSAISAALTPAPQTIAVAATPPNSFTDGTYLVGSDMPAGNYVTDGTGSSTPSGSCYWSRNKNDGGSAGDVIKNNYGAGPGRFTAQAGEVVELKSGCTWTKK